MEKVAQQEDELKPEPEMPAEIPVAHRLCLSRLSTLPSPSWPIRWPMYSLGLVLYRLFFQEWAKRKRGWGVENKLVFGEFGRVQHGGLEGKTEKVHAVADRLGGLV